jgi:hypothetical protein
MGDSLKSTEITGILCEEVSYKRTCQTEIRALSVDDKVEQSSSV